MKISAIIATRNEERNIKNCIGSLREQSHPDIEIIVVDNGSTDRTIEIARECGVDVYDLSKEISLEGVLNFRGAQVNFGAEKASGEIIFFPDADMTFEKSLLAEAANLMTDLNALYIPEHVMGKGFFGRIRHFERSFYNATCIDALRVIKMDLYREIGGFDEKNIMFAPDDWDLTRMVQQKTGKIGITKAAIYHHEEWLDVKTYLNKKKQYYQTFDGYIAKWGRKDPILRKQLSPWYRLIGVFFEKGKFLKLLRHPILATGMYCLRFLVAVRFLFHKSG